MANLIVICGPQAVGKMTVAESLRDKLHYNLMTNHDSIEVSDRIFGFNTPAQREFNGIFRQQAFALAVKHNVDMLFTLVCAFEKPEEREYLTALARLFEEAGGKFFAHAEKKGRIDPMIEEHIHLDHILAQTDPMLQNRFFQFLHRVRRLPFFGR